MKNLQAELGRRTWGAGWGRQCEAGPLLLGEHLCFRNFKSGSAMGALGRLLQEGGRGKQESYLESHFFPCCESCGWELRKDFKHFCCSLEM